MMMQSTKNAPTTTNDFVALATLEWQGGHEYDLFIDDDYVRVFFDRRVSDDFKVLTGNIHLTQRELDSLYERLCVEFPEREKHQGEEPYNPYDYATSTLANR